jgi:hypothetical protein
MLDWLAAPHAPVLEKSTRYGMFRVHRSAPRSDYWTSDDRSSSEELPETPAHLFAVRAFKTALFGTPALPQTVHTTRTTEANIIDASAKPAQVPETRSEENQEHRAREITVDTEERKLENARRRDPLASPSKGILLTPGTAAAKRKSVSWGGLKKAALVDPIKSADSIVLRENASTEADEAGANEQEDLRRNLFQSKLRMPINSITSALIESSPTLRDKEYGLPKTPDLSSLDHNKDLQANLDSGGDITIDLKSPRSRSGQHWKWEYQRDHDKSKLEMRKLIRYGQAAKSYAVKRDHEAIRLGGKLKDTETQMKEMEAKVAELANDLANTRSHGDNHARILDDLATQTAQALRYKAKAERYRLALRHSQPTVPDDTLTMSQALPIDAMAQLELQSLRVTAEQAQRKADELEKRNTALRQSLARAKDELKHQEERHTRRLERQKLKEEKLLAEKQDLKEQLAKVRDHQHELQKQSDRSRTKDGTVPVTLTSLEASSKDSRSLRSSVLAPLPEIPSRRHRPISDLPTPDASDDQFNEPFNSRSRPYARSPSKDNRNEGLKERTASTLNRRQSETTSRIPLDMSPPQESLDSWLPKNNIFTPAPVSPFVPASSPHKEILAPISYNTTFRHPKLNNNIRPQGSGNHAATSQKVSDSMLSSSTSSTGASARKALTADRIAAAKKRIEQRIADKRRTGGAKKENTRA